MASDKLSYNVHFVKNKKFENKGRKYSEYRKLWDEAALKHIVLPFPLHLDIEVTSYCNLKCPICSRTHLLREGRWADENMSFDMFRAIIDEGAENGLCAVNLNNFGEPLINKDIVKMIRYAKKRGIIDIMMHTNGTLLTESLSRELIGSGIDTVIFSFDSVNKDVYEKIRVGADFEETVRKIKEFISMRNSMGNGRPSIRMSMVRMKDNFDEVEEYAAFWGDEVDMISYTDYRNQNNADDADRYAVRRRPNYGYVCPFLWRRLTVNADGVVVACCRDAARKLVVGDFKESSIKDIWHGDKMNELREMHLSGRAYQVEGCRGCDHVKGAEGEF